MFEQFYLKFEGHSLSLREYLLSFGVAIDPRIHVLIAQWPSVGCRRQAACICPFAPSDRAVTGYINAGPSEGRKEGKKRRKALID